MFARAGLPPKMNTDGTISKLVRNIATISIGVTRVSTSTSRNRALSHYINALEKCSKVYIYIMFLVAHLALGLIGEGELYCPIEKYYLFLKKEIIYCYCCCFVFFLGFLYIHIYNIKNIIITL